MVVFQDGSGILGLGMEEIKSGQQAGMVFKGTVSRDNLYPIFFIDHILLVSLEYSMRILNFDEFSRCSSTEKETRRCRLHR